MKKQIPIFAILPCLDAAIKEYKKPVSRVFVGNPTHDQIEQGTAKQSEEAKNHFRALVALAYFSSVSVRTNCIGNPDDLLDEWFERHPRETSMNLRVVGDGIEIFSEYDEKEKN